MHVKLLQTARAAGFTRRAIERQRERPVMLPYLRHKSSFLIATIALTAFVAGNMIGKHGWYVFWASVLGQFDDSLITYTGTVTPAEKVADPECWARYSGDVGEHTWRQVPETCRIPLPRYAVDRSGMPTNSLYSVGYMGSYDGREGGGSHPGIDIRLPLGTPVRAIANGIVTDVGENRGGFGKYVVIRLPHVPDPDDPKKTTVLYSAYAHLSAQLVAKGQTVDKGEEIALSGQSGNASGPHLHFQMDRSLTLSGEETPWHPYWPFSGTDARRSGLNFSEAINSGLYQERGYEYTIHPMKYVQASYPGTALARTVTGKKQVVAMAEPGEQPHRRAPQGEKNPRVSRATELKANAVTQKQKRIAWQHAMERFLPKPVRLSMPAPAPPSNAKPVKGVAIEHDGTFSGREWKTIRVSLLDDAGNVTTAEGLKGVLHLVTAFGHAEFDPAVLSPAHFKDGIATVRMLPQGTQTVVIDVKPFHSLSKPLKYAGR